ncbi:MAG: hypothetical protein AB8E15_01125 [Bdellovibrionales bacterium]
MNSEKQQYRRNLYLMTGAILFLGLAVMQFSHFKFKGSSRSVAESSELSTSQKELLFAIEIIEKDGEHFVQLPSELSSTNICSEYTDLYLEFAAKGMAVSGDTPIMMVSSRCQVNDSGRVFVKVPVKSFSARQPSSYTKEPTSDGSEVSFKNIFMEWPDTWVLQKISLEGNKALSLGPEELSAYTHKLSWN